MSKLNGYLLILFALSRFFCLDFCVLCLLMCFLKVSSSMVYFLFFLVIVCPAKRKSKTLNLFTRKTEKLSFNVFVFEILWFLKRAQSWQARPFLQRQAASENRPRWCSRCVKRVHLFIKMCHKKCQEKQTCCCGFVRKYKPFEIYLTSSNYGYIRTLCPGFFG